MSPSVPVSWGEVIDKITILEIKSAKLNSEAALKNVDAYREISTAWMAARTLEEVEAAFQKWLADPASRPELPPGLVLDFTEAKSGGGATFTPQPDGSLLAAGTSP